MIVNYSEKGWSIVLQRSHGLLAAQMCGHWAIEKQPARWVETLIATAEHDDVNDELSEPELNPETGGPTNFKMKSFDTALCDMLLHKAFAKGTYVGLLIARHIRFLYQQDPAAKKYCADLNKQEKQWLKTAHATEQEIAASYELLEFCDAFSLIICQGIIQPEDRKMEISTGPDGNTYTLCTRTDGTLNVMPWPFEKDELTLRYETRTVPQLSFGHAGAFRDALQAAPVQLHEVKVVRGE